MSEPERPSKQEKGDQRPHRQPAGNERRRASLHRFDCCQVSAVYTCVVRAGCFDEASAVGVAEVDAVKKQNTNSGGIVQLDGNRNHTQASLSLQYVTVFMSVLI